MAARGVLVTCRLPGDRQNTNNSVSSGVLFGNKWVLTLGTILEPILNSGNSSYQTEVLFKPSTTVDRLAIIPDTSQSSTSPSFTVLVEDNGTLCRNESCKEVTRIDVPRCEKHDVQFVAAWKCPLMTEAINTVLSSWQLNPDEQEKQPNKLFKTLLSTILLLRIDSDVIPKRLTVEDVNAGIDELMRYVELPRRGQHVIIESSLFGSEFFLNSLSEGIVSNLLGPEDCVLLTDARTGPGCEGGPIFEHTQGRSLDERRLLGLVLNTVSWWKGEWVGFTLGVALRPVLRNLRSRGGQSTIPPAVPRAASLNVLDKGVVLVRCGVSWGTGVVVDASLGLILTCSHVVRNSKMDISVAWRGGGVARPASLLFRTRDGVAYDIAVLRVSPLPANQQVVFSRSPPVRGEVIFVVGFPLFSELANPSLRATATRGLVAHVTSPAMLQTTCCVQSGASGGPVLRPDGQLLGVVACNARDTETGAVFPRVNMAIPTLAFEEPIRRYVETLDVQEFSQLEDENEYVQKLWRLNVTKCKM